MKLDYRTPPRDIKVGGSPPFTWGAKALALLGASVLLMLIGLVLGTSGQGYLLLPLAGLSVCTAFSSFVLACVGVEHDRSKWLPAIAIVLVLIYAAAVVGLVLFTVALAKGFGAFGASGR
jgi:hypothetical protein